MANTRKNQFQKARNKGPSPMEEQRGPNTGGWEKLYTNWRPGAFSKYSRTWNSGYDGPGKGTW